MTDFLQELMNQRRKLLDALDENQGDINLDIFEDFYPDQAHFVFELLQNAEDTGATEVSFRVTKDGCWFEHNGKRTFSEADVRAITGIHNSTKKKDPDQIGKFGVGFKSVFVYTLTPTIYSASFSFKISKFVLPEPVAPDPSIGSRTRFWLPFNNPAIDPARAFSEIQSGLSKLAETTLLFLNNIESIKWQTDEGVTGEILREHHSDFHIEVLKHANGSPTTSAHFLKFDRPVEGLEKQRLAIAFALDFQSNVSGFSLGKPLSQQMRIVSATPGQVAVFFPAEKETSGLRFHLHAPFVPELSRASIKENPINDPLFAQLAGLTAASLHHVRDLGLLTVDFLGVLPNPQDSLGKPYHCIRDAIVHEMNNQPLTPTRQKGHAPAKHLVQAKAALKDLLSLDDIEYLISYEEEPPQWAEGGIRSTPTEKFMESLAIQTWDVEQFVEKIEADATENSYSDPEEDFMKWIGGKSVEWHQQLYALLYSELNPEGDLYRVNECKIVRLMSGEYSVGPSSYFPDEKGQHRNIFPCVDPAVYTSGKSPSQQEKARKFLEEIDVKEIGERELIEAVLDQRYSTKDQQFSEKTYASDIRRFIKLIEDDPTASSLFRPYYLFLGVDSKWHKASEIYIDAPFEDTGLAEYYRVLDDSEGRSPLASFYTELPIDTPKIVRFARAIGAKAGIEISTISCSKNPFWHRLSAVGGQRHTNYINRDYEIDDFVQLASAESEAISLLIWRTMISNSPKANYDTKYSQNILRAVYQRNDSGGTNYEDSKLVHDLRAASWVPQKGGKFVPPAKARSEDLPDGFTFDAGWSWVKAIRFGSEVISEEAAARVQALSLQEAARKREVTAKELGFPDAQTAERLKKYAEIPEAELSRFYEDWERRRSIELPENEPSNPDRRSARVIADAIIAPERRTEQKMRSVSVGREAVKGEAEPYLKQQYAKDAEIFCQVCDEPLPFKLDDGEYYIEKTELIEGLKRRHYQNYLCLCPNHAAMWKHANGSKQSLRAELAALESNRLPVVLGQRDNSVYFTRTHLLDIQALIKADDDLAAQYDDEGIEDAAQEA